MTIKQMAEVSGVSAETVRTKGKELYPERFKNGKKTIFNQIEAINIMAELRKRGFIKPTENIELPTENMELGNNDLDKAFKLAIIALTRNTENLDKRMTVIEQKIEQRKALLPAPQIDPRNHIVRLVTDHVAKTGLEFREVYRNLYREYGYRTHCNASLCAKNRGMKIIDFIDSEGQIEILESIAMEIL